MASPKYLTGILALILIVVAVGALLVFCPYESLSPLQTVQASFPGMSGKIVYASNSDIHVMDPDGSNKINLTNTFSCAEFTPTWSADGLKIAFTRTCGADFEIYVMNADGSSQTNLTNSPVSNELWPAWSADGRKIAFETDRDGAPEIYVINADGTGLKNISNNPAPDQEPSWSPDGSKIAFNRQGSLWLMNTEGAAQTNLYVTIIGKPNWSPGGTKIVLVRAVGTNEAGRILTGIFIVNADGTGLTELSRQNGNHYFPAWSPDGKKIVFQSDVDRNDEIYVMRTDGSNHVNLTNNPSASDSQPDWQVKPMPRGRSTLTPEFKLPWTGGETWFFTGGPHCDFTDVGEDCPTKGRPTRTIRYAVDFAPPENIPCVTGFEIATNRWVRAAASGRVIKADQSIVEIQHTGGWVSGYVHLDNIMVKPGDKVEQGDKLGNPSCKSPPRGSATGVHVHFYFKKDGRYIPIEGMILSGWTINATDGNYEGTMTKSGEDLRTADGRRCLPTSNCTKDGLPTQNDLTSDNY